MTILVPVTEEKSQIVPTGVDLAEAYDDTLVLLHVVSDKDAESHLEALSESDSLQDSSITQQEERAATYAERIGKNTIDDYDSHQIETRGRIGTPAQEVVSVADELDARYIVVGGRQRSPTGKAIFGSTTQDILLSTNRPVVTIMQE